MREEKECGVRVLEEYLDREVLVLTRDNVFTYGILRSFDQYHNILLDTVIEVTVAGDECSEQQSEISMFRGENIVLLGRTDKPLRIPFRKTDHATILEKTKNEMPEDLDYIAL